MPGDVDVRVEYSTVNYKDGLAITGKLPVVRRFPMIPGIDFAGTVTASTHADFKPGDKVILNGWGARRDALRRLQPDGAGEGRLADPAARRPHRRRGDGDRHRRLHGDAGVMALERHGITPARGPVVVTGAAGGVGSMAVALLAGLGYTVDAVDRPRRTSTTT